MIVACWHSVRLATPEALRQSGQHGAAGALLTASWMHAGWNAWLQAVMSLNDVDIGSQHMGQLSIVISLVGGET